MSVRRFSKLGRPCALVSCFHSSSENTCLLDPVCFDSNSDTVNCSNVPSSNTDCLKNTKHSRCANALLFDTDSGTSVDKHTFTESLTSDSLNETSPSSDTCCTVEGSR